MHDTETGVSKTANQNDNALDPNTQQERQTLERASNNHQAHSSALNLETSINRGLKVDSRFWVFLK
jgi:hypothetical protein